MAEFVFTDAFVSINGTDLSDHVRQVAINYSAELQDDTAMGDTTRSRLPGLLDWSIEVEFNQDYQDAPAKVDKTLFDLVGAAAFTVVVRPDNTAGVGVNNPNFTATSGAVLESYSPLGGSVGDLATTSITLQAAGVALQRLTA